MRKFIEKNALPLGLAVMLLVVLSVVFFTRSSEELLNEGQKLTAQESIKYKLVENSASRATLAFSNPADRGIKVVSATMRPKTQEDWNSYMRENYNKFQDNLPAELKEKLVNASHDKEKYQMKKDYINEQLAEYQQRLENNPRDKEAKQMIEQVQIFNALDNLLQDQAALK